MDNTETTEKTKSCDFRMTRQRRVILAELDSPGQHPTADEVYSRVRKVLPNISLGTVYRNLEILSQTGMVKKLHIGSEQRRYEKNQKRHYHAHCVMCGRVSDIPSDPFGDIDKTARENSRFDITGHELVFEGLCPKCNDDNQ
ncbi:MAG: transcriptional repressor [Phycisphaerales bacterium]|nr:transcriptional repressor [Phycisphaerales bacterium]